MSTATLEEAIIQNAAGVKRQQIDNMSVENHSLRDQIEADKYLQSKNAVKKGLGVKFVKIKADGDDFTGKLQIGTNQSGAADDDVLGI